MAPMTERAATTPQPPQPSQPQLQPTTTTQVGSEADVTGEKNPTWRTATANNKTASAGSQKLRRAISLQEGPEATAKALEAAGAENIHEKEKEKFVSCFRSTGTLSVPERRLSSGGGVLPPPPGAPVVSASSVQEELKRAFRRGLGAKKAVAKFKRPMVKAASFDSNGEKRAPQEGPKKKDAGEPARPSDTKPDHNREEEVATGKPKASPSGQERPRRLQVVETIQEEMMSDDAHLQTDSSERPRQRQQDRTEQEATLSNQEQQQPHDLGREQQQKQQTEQENKDEEDAKLCVTQQNQNQYSQEKEQRNQDQQQNQKQKQKQQESQQQQQLQPQLQQQKQQQKQQQQQQQQQQEQLPNEQNNKHLQTHEKQQQEQEHQLLNKHASHFKNEQNHDGKLDTEQAQISPEKLENHKQQIMQQHSQEESPGDNSSEAPFQRQHAIPDTRADDSTTAGKSNKQQQKPQPPPTKAKSSNRIAGVLLDAGGLAALPAVAEASKEEEEKEREGEASTTVPVRDGVRDSGICEGAKHRGQEAANQRRNERKDKDGQVRGNSSCSSSSSSFRKRNLDETRTTGKDKGQKTQTPPLALVGPAREETIPEDLSSSSPVVVKQEAAAPNLPRSSSLSALSRAALVTTEKGQAACRVDRATKPVIHLCLPVATEGKEERRFVPDVVRDDREEEEHEDEDAESRRLREEFASLVSPKRRRQPSCAKHSKCHCYLFSLDTVGFYALS